LGHAQSLGEAAVAAGGGLQPPVPIARSLLGATVAAGRGVYPDPIAQVLVVRELAWTGPVTWSPAASIRQFAEDGVARATLWASSTWGTVWPRATLVVKGLEIWPRPMPWLPTATTGQFVKDGAIANWMGIVVGAESTGELKGFPESPVSVRVDAWVAGSSNQHESLRRQYISQVPKVIAGASEAGVARVRGSTQVMMTESRIWVNQGLAPPLG
jgi:hypothetical protein